MAALEARGIPVVTLISDVPQSARIAYAGPDHFQSGRSAGYFIARMSRRPGPVAVLCNNAGVAVGGKLRIDRFPVHLFEPYFGDAIRLSLLRAEAGWQGDFNAQAAPAGWTVSANGDARLSDLRLHTRAAPGAESSDELLSWQAFTLGGVRFAMAPASLPQLEVREAALNDFFARLVVTEQGRLNLSSVAAADAASSAPAAAGAASAPAPAVAGASAASAASAAAPAWPIALSVGGVGLMAVVVEIGLITIH